MIHHIIVGRHSRWNMSKSDYYRWPIISCIYTFAFGLESYVKIISWDVAAWPAKWFPVDRARPK